ncbi:MAG: O-antigen ligase family protein [Gaiellaceae bacterium]
MAYSEPVPRPGVPLAVLAGGTAVLFGSLAYGPKSAAGGAVVFLLACALAAREAASPVVTWPNTIVALALVIWFIPIKLYALPVSLPFQLEPYRLFLLVLLFALVVSVATGGKRLGAAGHGKPVIVLAVVALATTIVNFSDVADASGETPLKPLSYFLGFLIVFVLVCSTIDRLQDVEKLVRVLVLGGAVVALAALFESRTGTNVFDSLDRFLPLQKEERELVKVRGAQLRVFASAQHPIALGCALVLTLPLALYLAEQAVTKAKTRFWLLAAVVSAAGAVATISRTTVVMLVVMSLLAVGLRGARIARYWPVVLLFPFVVHFVAPGALGTLYNSFFPETGLIGDLTERAGEGGSGRFADLSPGLDAWAREPLVGRGLGSVITTGDDLTRLGVAPPTEIIFDNQYVATLVTTGVLGLAGVIWFVWGSVAKVAGVARRTIGGSGDLLAACSVSCAGFGAAMFFFDAFAFVQATLVFVFIAALGLRVREQRRQGTITT